MREYQHDAAEMFEALALDRRTDRILPNGYCTLPPRQACDKDNACLSCTKPVTDARFTDALLRQREETRDLIQRRQTAHQERFGESMTDDNVWLKGRTEELTALTAVLHAIDSVRREDDTIVPLRGAGAPPATPGQPAQRPAGACLVNRNHSIQALTDAAQQGTAAAEQAVQKAQRKARKDNEPITVTGLATAAGVSTDFIYRHPVLRAQVEALRRTRGGAPSTQCSTTDIEAASSTLVRRLSQQLADARRAHHEEVAELRKALEVAHGELLTLRRKLDDAARGDQRVGDRACQRPCCARSHA